MVGEIVHTVGHAIINIINNILPTILIILFSILLINIILILILILILLPAVASLLANRENWGGCKLRGMATTRTKPSRGQTVPRKLKQRRQGAVGSGEGDGGGDQRRFHRRLDNGER